MRERISRRLFPRGRRQDGLALLEVTMALALFVAVGMGAYFTLLRAVQQEGTSHEEHLAMAAVRDLAAEVQETANRPTDLSRGEGIGAIFTRFHRRSFAAANLPGGTIAVECFANETTVPALLGGRQDLNFDGDSDDDLANQSSGSDLRLVPMELRVDYGTPPERRSLILRRLLTKTVD